ncbi:MAG: hypothetical protein IJ621_02610 [Paludibacteraceae bacterium]|nr:hypothetical protein [Paludibacteraceae bacterium]
MRFVLPLRAEKGADTAEEYGESRWGVRGDTVGSMGKIRWGVWGEPVGSIRKE